MKPTNPFMGQGLGTTRPGKSSGAPGISAITAQQATQQQMPPPWMTPTPPAQGRPRMGGKKNAQQPAVPDRTTQPVSGGMQNGR